MAKLTERVAIANGDISDDDLIHIVHDAGGTPISYKMTVGQLKTFISAITGSGVDNQIAVYNGTDTIEGDASLTWDGNTIRVTGDASNKAQLTLDSDSTQNAVINLNTNGGASNSVIQFQVSDLTKYMVGINGEDDDATNQMFIITNGDSFDDDGVIVMKPNGNVGIGLGNSGEPSANKLEVGGADTTNASLKIRPQSGTPTTPESGQLRNDAGAPMWYDGSAWVDLASGGGGSPWTDTGSSISYSGHGDYVEFKNDYFQIAPTNTSNTLGTFSNQSVYIGTGISAGGGSGSVNRVYAQGQNHTLAGTSNLSDSFILGSGHTVAQGNRSFVVGENITIGDVENSFVGGNTMNASTADLFGSFIWNASTTTMVLNDTSSGLILLGKSDFGFDGDNIVGIGGDHYSTDATLSKHYAFGDRIRGRVSRQTVIGMGADAGSMLQLASGSANGVHLGVASTRPSFGLVKATAKSMTATATETTGLAYLGTGLPTALNVANTGDGVLWIENADTVPTATISGAGALYVEGGALKFRGGSGTVTTIANA